LDAGCGRGGVVELLHGQVALAVGVDPDRLSLVEHRAPAVRRAAGLMERLPFPDESFDLVVCSWVLEHLARPQRAFDEVSRVLQRHDPARGKIGGRMVFLAPNAWHPLAWANRVLGRAGAWQGRLVRRLYGRVEADTFPVVYRANTRRRITRLAKAAGLEPVAFYVVGDPTYLAFNEPLYHLAVLAERLTPRWMKVHLIGDLVKKCPCEISGNVSEWASSPTQKGRT
jgi:SAM-dependent methyltransferase